jgi:hypothetical protein
MKAWTPRPWTPRPPRAVKPFDLDLALPTMRAYHSSAIKWRQVEIECEGRGWAVQRFKQEAKALGLYPRPRKSPLPPGQAPGRRGYPKRETPELKAAVADFLVGRLTRKEAVKASGFSYATFHRRLAEVEV